MVDTKKIAMAVGTFSVALGIGFVMQNGDALASRFSAGDVAAAPPRPAVVPDAEPVAAVPETRPDVEQPAVDQVTLTVPDAETPMPAPTVTTANQPMVPAAVADAPPVAITEVLGTASGPAPDLSGPTLSIPDIAPIAASVLLPQLRAFTPRALPPAQPVQIAATEDAPVDLGNTTAGTGAEPLAGMGCDPVLEAQATAGSIVTLSLDAPCHPDQKVAIHHQGMLFTAMTDADGSARIETPALAEIAVFIAAFEDDLGAVVTVEVPDFDLFDRAVLQYQGDTAVNLSAYEFGARFGDDGHVWVEARGDMERLLSGEGGYLMRLGDPAATAGYFAEVYLFPSAMSERSGDVMLVAEAEITADNCGEELAAQSIQVQQGRDSTALDLIMVMPGCDAVGDYLVLQNMYEDLTLAAR
ncbi:MAG: hypothetical protein HLUCCA08_02880 [Rhodobacteraceae bacterium HLUCCA08]|nr:MAG: hypothetical protein HLUCCA08_02880 [Rhodobacteraceae bacterium HLUCCA08]